MQRPTLLDGLVEVGPRRTDVNHRIRAHHVFAVPSVSFRPVRGAELENKQDVVLDGFLDDEVEFAFALLAQQRVEAIEVLQYELTLVELHIELQAGGGVCKTGHGALRVAVLSVTVRPGSNKVSIPLDAFSDHSSGVRGGAV